MKLRDLAAIACCSIMGISAASADTISYTEGARPTVAGSIDIMPQDVSNTPPGLDVGDVGFGNGADEYEVIEIYGRIVGAVDNFNFTATSNFVIEFIFSGYDLEAGGTVLTSGFVNDGTSGSTSEFSLSGPGVIGANMVTLMTDITSGTALIFAGTAGDYVFSIDGMSAAALYDIQIRAVPIPAALPLFAAGLGGLGWFSRRRRRVTA